MSSGDSAAVTLADEVIRKSFNERVRRLSEERRRQKEEEQDRIRSLQTQVEREKRERNVEAMEKSTALGELNLLLLRGEKGLDAPGGAVEGEMELSRADVAIRVIRQMLREKKG